MAKMTKAKNKSSKYIGISFNKESKKYKSEIMINGKSKFLGYFLSELEAARAYNDYIISHNLSHFNLNEF